MITIIQAGLDKGSLPESSFLAPMVLLSTEVFFGKYFLVALSEYLLGFCKRDCPCKP